MADKQTSQPEATSKILTGQCYCKAVHFNIAVPTSSLPLKTHVCHCSICRYTHGTLCVFHAPLPSGVAPSFIAPSSLSSLTAYRHATASSTRYFCSTCSCHIGDQGIDDDDWVISVSIFDANKDDVPPAWDIRTHVNTDSAPGSGLYDWLPRMAGENMKVWNPKKPDAEIATPAREVGSDGEEVLRAQCHCGGVSFTVSRPDVNNKSYAPWISKVEPNKWMAGLDVCGDCRLQTGTHVAAWVFVPESCISPKVPEDLKIGTAKTYRSSENVLRANCGKCGATALGFYNGGGRLMESGERILNIGVGMLRAPEGSLAQDWLEYKTGGGAGQPDSGRKYDAVFVDSLIEGMAAWEKDRQGDR